MGILLPVRGQQICRPLSGVQVPGEQPPNGLLPALLADLGDGPVGGVNLEQIVELVTVRRRAIADDRASTRASSASPTGSRACPSSAAAASRLIADPHHRPSIRKAVHQDKPFWPLQHQQRRHPHLETRSRRQAARRQLIQPPPLVSQPVRHRAPSPASTRGQPRARQSDPPAAARHKPAATPPKHPAPPATRPAPTMLANNCRASSGVNTSQVNHGATRQIRQPPPTGHQHHTRRRPGQQRLHLSGIPRIIQNNQRPPPRSADCGMRGAFHRTVRDAVRRKPRISPKEPGQDLRRRRRMRSRTTQLREELPIQETTTHPWAACTASVVLPVPPAPVTTATVTAPGWPVRTPAVSTRSRRAACSARPVKSAISAGS